MREVARRIDSRDLELVRLDALPDDVLPDDVLEEHDEAEGGEHEEINENHD